MDIHELVERHERRRARWSKAREEYEATAHLRRRNRERLTGAQAVRLEMANHEYMTALRYYKTSVEELSEETERVLAEAVKQLGIRS